MSVNKAILEIRMQNSSLLSAFTGLKNAESHDAICDEHRVIGDITQNIQKELGLILSEAETIHGAKMRALAT